MNATPTTPRDGPEATYAYKSALIGPPWEFHLTANALAWRKGTGAGEIAYRDIRRLRQSFRPITMQTHRFLTEIWAARGPKIKIASTSWRSFVEQERHDAAYSAFIRELHRRLAAVHPGALCDSGSAAWLYWPGLVAVVTVALAMAALTLRALQLGEWAGVALIGGFLALFARQSVVFLRRNRPRRYDPHAPPEDLLP